MTDFQTIIPLDRGFIIGRTESHDTWNNVAIHPLTEARKKKNISQGKLAIATEIPPSAISKIENWHIHPCPSWRDRLSRFFNTPEHELFPAPADLLDIIRVLSEENLALKKELETAKSQSSSFLHKHRNNARYLT